AAGGSNLTLTCLLDASLTRRLLRVGRLRLLFEALLHLAEEGVGARVARGSLARLLEDFDAARVAEFDESAARSAREREAEGRRRFQERLGEGLERARVAAADHAEQRDGHRAHAFRVARGGIAQPRVESAPVAERGQAHESRRAHAVAPRRLVEQLRERVVCGGTLSRAERERGGADDAVASVAQQLLE